MKGTVQFFDETKGFGLIDPDEGDKNIYVQRANIHTPNKNLYEGQRVEFEIVRGARGFEAVNIRATE